jgi:Protein of unknown function (DUF2865)
MKINLSKARAGRILALLASGLVVVVGLVAFPAQSQNADCDRLRQQIADAGNSSGSAQYQAAADKQSAEIDRMSAYARSIGCDNRKFLFFGSEPPAQCAQITPQLERMRANLGDLRARAGGGRGELVARYNQQCVTQPAQRNGGLFDALFGNNHGAQPQTDDVTVEPLMPDGQLTNPGEARAGSLAVCVRTCDGSFFPVSYSASGGRLGDLDAMCHALCPNADVSVYTYPPSGEIEQAVSPSGQRYMDSPNALKFRTSYDSTCTCKRKGESWAEALAGAEARLGPENKGDIIVTPQKSIELSRAKPDDKTDTKAKNAKSAKGAKPSPTPTPSVAAGTDVNGVDTNLSAQAAAISRDTTGIAGGVDSSATPVAKDQGPTVEENGPNGVKRRVRVIDPAL